MKHWKSPLIAIAAVFLTPIVLWGIIWLPAHFIFDGYKLNQRLEQFLLANMHGGFFWVLLGIQMLLSAIILFAYADNCDSHRYRRDYYGYSYDRKKDVEDERPKSVSKAMSALGIVALLLFGLSTYQTTKVAWDNDKDLARYYDSAATFYVPKNDQHPSAVKYLVAGAKPSTGRCDFIDRSDMHTCIKIGSLPESGWEPRVGSLDGAIYAIKRTSGDEQRVSLNTGMVTYLNAHDGQPAAWSGVLDGSGKEQPLGGVSEWDGNSSTKTCKFEGRYGIDRAFAGDRGNSLSNMLSSRYPALRYDETDVWGYCKGKEPIIVIPMTRQIPNRSRTVRAAGGIVVVQGSHGHVKLTHIADPKPGAYPGPVYPASQVVRQRENLAWAAGRKNEDRRSFGFSPASASAQAGNTSEYLLKNKATGRLEWVTPMTLKSSTSELFVAYSITPADTASDGHLNPMKVYVLSENDHRRINIDNLEADALDYLSKNAGTFISNGGKLVEFTPVDGDIWRAFGELKGRVVYRLEISANDRIAPNLVSLGATDEQAPSSTTTFCGQSVSTLTQNQLVTCIQKMSNELADRQQPHS